MSVAVAVAVANAPRYGMYFPLPNEAWHIEPVGTRQGAISQVAGGLAPRSRYPSEDEIERRLSQIEDPEVRELTRQRIKTAIAADGAAQEARQKQAQRMASGRSAFVHYFTHRVITFSYRKGRRFSIININVTTRQTVPLFVRTGRAAKRGIRQETRQQR